MAKDESSEHHGDGIAHVLPPGALIATWAVLMTFTVLTVWAAGQGMSSQTSFVVAMFFATVKAGAVMAVFMHLWWDKRLNLLVFLSAFLFVMLFLSMALTDKSEYEPSIEAKQADEAAQQ